MIKQHTSQYRGMSKDLASDKQDQKYFDAKNIRILATDQKSTFAATNELGTELILSIPTPVLSTDDTNISYEFNGATQSIEYKTQTNVIPRCVLEETYVESTNPTVIKTSGTQVIIGTTELRDSALIISTDSNGFDCFWELKNLSNGQFDLELKYMGDLDLSKENLVQIIFNYENSVIEKVYLVDGVHQIRSMNLRQSIENGDSKNLIDISPDTTNTVSNFSVSQIKINGLLSGGSHISGVVQYTYGLYILNGSQTTTAPFSETESIDKGYLLGGGEVNEVLGKSVSISIPNIDPKFTNIKIYRIKYTSYNQSPEISIINDSEIDDYTSMSFLDDGGIGEPISTEAFAFLGSNPIVPKHIVTKDSRLFPINVKELTFNSKAISELDCRAYSYEVSSSNSVIMNGTYIDENDQVNSAQEITVPADFNVPESFDSINRDYEVYQFIKGSNRHGGTGKYIEVEVGPVGASQLMTYEESQSYKFLKEREIYRIGIKFYNSRGQESEAKWVMDLVAPSGNLGRNYNTLEVKLTNEFYLWLNDSSNFESEYEKPVGYKLLRSDRTISDRTIHSQGMINPMVCNYITGDKHSYEKRKEIVNGGEGFIMPSVTRVFERVAPFNECKDYYPLATENTTNTSLERNRNVEGFRAASRADMRAQTFQQNKMMQFFSPETTFTDAPIDAGYKLRAIGVARSNAVSNWATEVNPKSMFKEVEAKFYGGINRNSPGVNVDPIKSNSYYLMDSGFFGPAGFRGLVNINQLRRSFDLAFYKAVTPVEKNTYEVYGAPEITEVGQDFKNYNSDSKYRYANHLKAMRMDNWDESDSADGKEQNVLGTNTNGSRCITFVLGEDSLPAESRVSIETIFSRLGSLTTGPSSSYSDGVILAEFVKDSRFLYTGNIYGGYSYENKTNSSYIEIGNYEDVNTDSTHILSPGDTFVQKFTFTKLAKENNFEANTSYNVLTEIVEVRVETTIDLMNRNDLSLFEWDNTWQPRYENYQKYNNVYSQQPTLIQDFSTSFKLKEIKEFDGRIMASKEKIPGEFIDNWTDFLENEQMDLDGKYGPINAVVNLNDEIFCLQDNAVAHISINPRAQIQAQDGVSIELGTGRLLNDYQYKSTTMGCLNKWGVVTGENSFYFVDAINRGVMAFDGSVRRLSDEKGFHNELLNRINYDELILDNPVLGTGSSVGYNPVNGDVYFSFHQLEDKFTLGFNEKIREFVSFYDYVPAWYINKGSVMISTDPSTTQVWEHFKGLPNHFYGVQHKSSVTLQIAPPGNEIILNNASYKLEMTDFNNNPIQNKGLTSVRVYNDYQDSEDVPLVLRTNVFFKNRNWKINLPRNKGTRDRVRGAWGFAEFNFDNPDGNKLILHDISVFYTQP